jgi:catechol 2,3-dioxygenase-like lactoylglutathione lyase family enzyme
MTVPSITGVVLDHVAHAVPDWGLAWPRYATELGAVWNSGGESPGFAPGQLRFANRARLEVLMPYEVESNDFLARFLQHNGPGPHHLTFRVHDIEAALVAVRSAGYEPIGINLTDPEWREAFIHPKQAHGIVVQVAQAASEWINPAPDGYPTTRRLRPDGLVVPAASLQRVTHAVADLPAAIALFGGLLGGQIEDRGFHQGEEWIDFLWDGPLAVRLIAPAAHAPSPELTEWLGGRPGRLHHLDMATEDPGSLTAARPAPPGLPGLAGGDGRPRWVIDPIDNLGLRLVITAL